MMLAVSEENLLLISNLEPLSLRFDRTPRMLLARHGGDPGT